MALDIFCRQPEKRWKKWITFLSIHFDWLKQRSQTEMCLQGPHCKKMWLAGRTKPIFSVRGPQLSFNHTKSLCFGIIAHFESRWGPQRSCWRGACGPRNFCLRSLVYCTFKVKKMKDYLLINFLQGENKKNDCLFEAVFQEMKAKHPGKVLLTIEHFQKYDCYNSHTRL